jgi:hypothetical protein
LTASADVRNPQTLNRYGYVSNSPYKFSDPIGLMQMGPGYCGANSSDCSESMSHAESLLENEWVTVSLNIVYDPKQMTEATAKEAMKAAVEDLQATYAGINGQFNVTYSAGAADMSSKDSDCRTCAYNITSGAKAGAINVFLHDNTSNQTSNVSYFRPENAQIFIEKVSGIAVGGKLTHEVGHLFRFFVNGNPVGGIPVPAFTGAGFDFVGSNNHSEDSIINSAHAAMKAGGLRYGRDFVDDFRSIKWTEVIPARTANILGDLAPRHVVTRSATPYDIFRLGARIVAAQ